VVKEALSKIDPQNVLPKTCSRFICTKNGLLNEIGKMTVHNQGLLKMVLDGPFDTKRQAKAQLGEYSEDKATVVL